MRKFWKREPTVNESADKPSSGECIKNGDLAERAVFLF